MSAKEIRENATDGTVSQVLVEERDPGFGHGLVGG